MKQLLNTFVFECKFSGADEARCQWVSYWQIFFTPTLRKVEKACGVWPWGSLQLLLFSIPVGFHYASLEAGISSIIYSSSLHQFSPLLRCNLKAGLIRAMAACTFSWRGKGILPLSDKKLIMKPARCKARQESEKEECRPPCHEGQIQHSYQPSPQTSLGFFLITDAPLSPHVGANWSKYINKLWCLAHQQLAYVVNI